MSSYQGDHVTRRPSTSPINSQLPASEGTPHDRRRRVSSEPKISPSKLIPWITTAVGIAGVLTAAGVLHYQRPDVVTPYQQQVHAACSRLQQIHTASVQSLGLSVTINPPSGFGSDSDTFRMPAPNADMFTIDKAAVLQALQSDYATSKIEFDQLDHQSAPAALKDQKSREEVAKNNYLAAELMVVQQVRTALPNQAPVPQAEALIGILSGSAPQAIELDDAMSALAGSNCTTIPPQSSSGSGSR